MVLSVEENKKRSEFADKLWNGAFKSNQVNLNEWMNTYDWEFLRCAAHGSIVIGNTELLYLISLFVHKTIQNPNSERYNDTEQLKNIIQNSNSQPGNINKMTHEQLVDYRNYQVFRDVKTVIKSILFCMTELQEKDKNYDEIIKMFSKSPIEECRLYCCGTVNNPELFLNDDVERIRKIAAIRVNFESKLESCSIDEKDLINFLTTAIKNGAIECGDGLIPYYNEDGTSRDDLMCAKFDSPLFIDKGGAGFHDKFDADICCNIKDKRILAYALYELLLNKQETFVEGMQPASWKKIVCKKNAQLRL
jgi:hypothetical protein